MTRAVFWCMLAAACVSVTPARASAEPIVVGFELTVQFAGGTMQDIFGSPLQVGDTVRGTLTYDTSGPGGSSSPTSASYRPEGALSLDLGAGLRIPTDTLHVSDNASCFPGVPCDGFGVLAFGTGLLGLDHVRAELDLRGGPDVWSGLALPTTTAQLAAFPMARLRVDIIDRWENAPWDDFTHAFSGPVVFAEAPAPIPEPATWLLVASGAGLLAARRRRVGAARRT